MEISEAEYKSLKAKADKWDKLDDKLAEFYPENEEDSEADLADIGEVAAMAFGYL